MLDLHDANFTWLAFIIVVHYAKFTWLAFIIVLNYISIRMWGNKLVFLVNFIIFWVKYVFSTYK